jgi:hypothetical protein
MNKRKLAAVVAAAAIGGGFGFAPAAMAWVNNSQHYVYASCWRWIGSSTATFGADSGHHYVGAGQRINYAHQTDAWLKYNGSDKSYVGSSNAGPVKIRKDHGGVNGGGGWKVYARHYNGGTMESDGCTIT